MWLWDECLGRFCLLDILLWFNFDSFCWFGLRWSQCDINLLDNPYFYGFLHSISRQYCCLSGFMFILFSGCFLGFFLRISLFLCTFLLD